MNIINHKHIQVDGKLTEIEIPHKNKFISIITSICKFVFETIHYNHYKQEWNGYKRLKTIKILGFRTALVEDLSQRTRMTFYFKIGKYKL